MIELTLELVDSRGETYLARRKCQSVPRREDNLKFGQLYYSVSAVEYDVTTNNTKVTVRCYLNKALTEVMSRSRARAKKIDREWELG
jgi:ATP-dependent Clp protease adapter protein ClpS